MDNTKLRDFERITQERRGNLIKSENWNNNFNRVEEVINENNETIKANFDNIDASTVPSDAIPDLGQDAPSFIFEQLVLIVAELLKKVDSTDYESANAINIKEVTFDENTGIFKFTRNNSEVVSIDTSLEKVPANFELVESGDKVYLKITNIDGSFSQTDVTSLLNVYTLNGSDSVEVNGSGYEYTFRVKENSITEILLSPSVMQTINDKTTDASASASSASTSAINAKQSEDNAKLYADQAKTSATASAESANASESAKLSAEESANNAETYASNAASSANTASSFSNSAKNYSESAESSANAAEDAKNDILNMTVSAIGLPAGSSPTVTKTNKPDGTVNLSFGLAQGEKGEKGETGRGLTILGSYSSFEELQQAVSSPETGDAYLVGATEPYDVYIYDGVTKEWINCGQLKIEYGVKVFIQVDEPYENKCIWFKPVEDVVQDTQEVTFELSDNENGRYFAEIDGNTKTIDNIVDSESQLSQGKYNFEIL